MAEQERVLRKLMKLSVKHDLPIILHSRKAEKRVFELCKEEQVTKADFHCFAGKVSDDKDIEHFPVINTNSTTNTNH